MRFHGHFLPRRMTGRPTEFMLNASLGRRGVFVGWIRNIGHVLERADL